VRASLQTGPHLNPLAQGEEICLCASVMIFNRQIDLATMANVATALAVLTGVVFGLVEAQRARRHGTNARVLDAAQAVGVILEDSAILFVPGSCRCRSSQIWWEARFAWPGENCSRVSNRNAIAAAGKKLSSGSNGWPCSWNVIQPEKLIFRPARTKLTVTGSRADECDARPASASRRIRRVRRFVAGRDVSPKRPTYSTDASERRPYLFAFRAQIAEHCQWLLT
jgi:hypothetical protein